MREICKRLVLVVGWSSGALVMGCASSSFSGASGRAQNEAATSTQASASAIPAPHGPHVMQKTPGDAAPGESALGQAADPSTDQSLGSEQQPLSVVPNFDGSAVDASSTTNPASTPGNAAAAPTATSTSTSASISTDAGPIPSSCQNLLLNTGQKDPVSGYTFFLIPEPMNLCESAYACQQQGGQLAWEGLQASDAIENCIDLGGWISNYRNEDQSYTCNGPQVIPDSSLALYTFDGDNAEPTDKFGPVVCVNLPLDPH